MAAIHELTDTWNDAGTVFDALHINVTDTASDAESMPLRASVGGVDKFAVRKDSRVRYGPDANNHWTHLVNSDGDLALTGVGSTGGAFNVTPASGKRVRFNMTGSAGGNAYFEVESSNGVILAAWHSISRSQVKLRRSRGTEGNPTTVAADDSLGAIAFQGYDGASIQQGGTIEAFVDGSPSSGNVPTRISFVTGTNTSTRKERLAIGADGNVGIGSTGAAKLHVTETTEQFRVGYDASNYWSETIGSTGNMALQGVSPTGGAFTLTTGNGQLIKLITNSVSNTIIDPETSVVIQGTEGRLELIGDDSGSNSSALLLNNAVGSGDSRVWYLGQATSGSGSTFHLAYNQNASPATINFVANALLTVETDGRLLLAGNINRRTSTAADPTTTEYPNSGDFGVHKNTSSGGLFLAANDGGAIKKVALT